MGIKVDIFSGFLGAGKTMLIKKLIEEDFYDDKLAIIENEFGEVSIDGEILKSTNVEVKEINSGCICCQVTGDFKKALYEIVNDYNVDRLIIEPTGIAKLSDIVKVFKSEGLEKFEIDHLITVIDVERFDLYLKNFKRFFIDQIKTCKTIVLSRTQLVDLECLNKVKSEIERISSKALIVSDNWYEVKAKDLLKKIEVVKRTEVKPLIRRGSTHIASITKEEEPKFESFALTINKLVSSDEIKSKFRFMVGDATFGNVIRAKGIINLNNGEKGQINFTVNECNIEPIKYSGDGVISFIGTNLNRNEIRKFFS